MARRNAIAHAVFMIRIDYRTALGGTTLRHLPDEESNRFLFEVEEWITV